MEASRTENSAELTAAREQLLAAQLRISDVVAASEQQMEALSMLHKEKNDVARESMALQALLKKAAEREQKLGTWGWG